MAIYNYKWIAVTDLLLDIQNPRYDPLANQEEALNEILVHQGDKLLRLARDIVREGANPADLPIVTPHPEARGKYIVMEGNRRVAAMRVLSDPSLASVCANDSVRRGLVSASREFAGKPVQELQCVVFRKRDLANHWIELRHTGENEGVGIVAWDAAAVARFAKGQSWIALQVLDFVKEKGNLDATAKEQLQHIPLTNLARLVNDPDVREALGLRAEKGHLKAHLPEKLVLKALTKVVKDVASGRKKVNDIRAKSQRLDYVANLVKSGHAPSTHVQCVRDWDLPSPPAGVVRRRGRPLSANRKSLIPARCVLAIRPHRLSTIYKELRCLDADRFPNCAAVLFRVFLELSCEEFITRTSISIHADSTLHVKVSSVAAFMHNNRLLDKDELKPVRVAVSNRHSILSIDTLHSYVHSKYMAPTSSDLKTTWENLQPFMEALWRETQAKE
ncbi:MAG: hypothetical protein IMZ44_23395 [Planctomycetes bacterium]|nr:hypothetical protein [Planctomycetota bacterium]